MLPLLQLLTSIFSLLSLKWLAQLLALPFFRQTFFASQPLPAPSPTPFRFLFWFQPLYRPGRHLLHVDRVGRSMMPPISQLLFHLKLEVVVLRQALSSRPQDYVMPHSRPLSRKTLRKVFSYTRQSHVSQQWQPHWLRLHTNQLATGVSQNLIRHFRNTGCKKKGGRVRGSFFRSPKGKLASSGTYL